jgi:hypothetical protein
MTELSPENKKIFEALVDYCSRYGNYIPLSFVLGFFVSNVMGRWWKQYQSIPWSTSIAVYVSSTIHGYDEVGRAMRRTIMRYVCLSLTMVFRVLSPRVKKRFPKMSDMVDAGLIHHNELAIIEDLERKFPGYSKNFLPIVWAATIVTRARKEGRILDDFAVKTIIESLNKFRGACGELMTYNTISIPLVYTQVVTIAVYTYFITSLVRLITFERLSLRQSNHSQMGQQYIETKASTTTNIGFNLDFVPILIILQFIFYMGWLKVAETLMNPFGEDDDDFDVNSMIDRNLQMSYIVVDEMHNEHPELLKDQYWDGIPQKLPDLAKDATEVVNTDGQDIVDYEVVKRRSTFFSANSTVILPASDKSKKIDDDVEQGHASHKVIFF